MTAERSGTAANLLLALVATLLTLGCLELGIRLIGPVETVDFDRAMRSPRRNGGALRLVDLIRRSRDADVVYELIPRVQGTFRGAPVRIDDHGRRLCPVSAGDDATRAVAPREYRLVGLGDSFMFGWGVADADTFLCRLETLVHDSVPGVRLRTFNLAAPGYNTHQEVAAFEAHGLDVAPDAVLVFLVRNDAELPNFLQRRTHDLLCYSALATLLRTRLGKPATDDGMPPGLRRGRGAPGGGALRTKPILARMVGEDAVRRALGHLAEMCRSRGIAMIYASQGGGLDDAVRPFVVRLGYRIVDVPLHRARYLSQTGQPPNALRLSSEDWHPNFAYHRLLAQWLFEDAVRDVVKAPAS